MSDFKISRRVLSGHENLLADAAHYSEEIFGSEPKGMVPVEIDEVAGIEAYTTRTTGVPRLKLYSKLMMPIVDRHEPKQQNKYLTFSNVGRYLLSRTSKVHGRPKEPKLRGKSVYDEMALVEYQYDINDREALPIIVSQFALRTPDNSQATELALKIDDDEPLLELFVRQHEICLNGIARYDKKFAEKIGAFERKVPFARLPADSTLEQIDQFQAELADKLPLRLIVGPIEDPLVR